MKLGVSIVGTKETRAQLLRLGDAGPLALAQTAEDLEELAEAGAAKHSKGGALVASTYLKRTGDGFEIGHDLQRAPHALWVHWGTKPHVIRPKNKKVLRFAAGGRFAFAKKVNHPGYKGDPWLARAAAQAPIDFQRRVDALLAQRETV